MKHLKTFENREIKYKYLSKEDALKIEVFVSKYISDLDIFNKIKKLKLSDFEEDDFDFDDMWATLINTKGDYNPNTFKKSVGNLYYNVDKYALSDMSGYNMLELRNSLFKILDKIYGEYVKNGIKTKIEERLIKLFEKKPEYYVELSRYDRESLPSNVQKACEWILSGEKYNL